MYGVVDLYTLSTEYPKIKLSLFMLKRNYRDRNCKLWLLCSVLKCFWFSSLTILQSVHSDETSPAITGGGLIVD